MANAPQVLTSTTPIELAARCQTRTCRVSLLRRRECVGVARRLSTPKKAPKKATPPLGLDIGVDTNLAAHREGYGDASRQAEQ